MYSRRSGLIIGFHGCDKTVQEGIVSGSIKDLIPKNNPWDWLGHGVYFWENNQDRALHFAQEQSKLKNSSIKTPAVIGAVIDLGHCLDLLDMANIILVQESYELLKDTFLVAGKTLPVNTNPKTHHISSDLLYRNLDCAVINHLHATKNDAFDSVKGIFMEGNPLYPNAGFREKDHIQICVRNVNCIKGFFFPRNLNNNFPKV